MTSEERREQRYKRRKAIRDEKRKNRFPDADNFDKVFSFDNLWVSYRNCRKGVSWKGSVQRYIFDAPIRVVQTRNKLRDGKYRCIKPHEWDTWERGKLRHIKSVPISERVMQRCLADNALVPILQRAFIYDNGACLPLKGYDFSQNRLKCHLRRFYQEAGTNEGYALLFDFSKFYERVNHVLVHNQMEKVFTDRKILGVIDQILGTFGNEGLALGSQISQIIALYSGNAFDHYIKQDLGIRYYARYNDDGYLIHPSKAYLEQCLEKIKVVAQSLHITLNEKKTRIVKISHGITFLKARIYLLPSGKIVRKMPKRSIVRERRKLKKLKKKMLAGIVDFEHIYMQYQSWKAFASKFDAWHTRRNMDALFHKLYMEELLCH